MNVLFLTLVGIDSIEDRGIYQDLLRKFRKEGHSVTIVTTAERRKNIPTNIKYQEGVTILQVRTFNIQKTNIIEKGIGTLAIEYQFLKAIKSFLSDVKFDLITYSTPPITFSKVIDFVKKRDKAYSYLLLKDIFPQNAVDMGMIKKGGFLHKQFLKREKKLYELSDTIGCMSQANVNFVIKHNPEINPQKVEINPNSIEPVQFVSDEASCTAIKEKYNLPLKQKIFVYGGNLGRPQGLDFLIETIGKNTNPKVFFLVVGDGTEFPKIQKWFERNQPQNALLLRTLQKDDYDKLLQICDVGLIYIDRNFLIPNFPSRLLSYLEMKKPIIAATDPNTDVGDVIETAGCGYKVLAGDIEEMNRKIEALTTSDDLVEMGEKGWELLQKEYLVEHSYHLIKSKLNV